MIICVVPELARRFGFRAFCLVKSCYCGSIALIFFLIALASIYIILPPPPANALSFSVSFLVSVTFRFSLLRMFASAILLRSLLVIRERMEIVLLVLDSTVLRLLRLNYCLLVLTETFLLTSVSIIVMLVWPAADFFFSAIYLCDCGN